MCVCVCVCDFTDRYEVSIPLESAGDCLEELGHAMYGPYALSSGTRTPFLTRFVKGEDGYLSNTNGGPRMYMNLEDFVLCVTHTTPLITLITHTHRHLSLFL